MMNLLISLMTTTFAKIQRNADVEWKFTRASLWIHYYEVGVLLYYDRSRGIYYLLTYSLLTTMQDLNSLPVPFNLIPSVHSMIKAYNWWTGAQDDFAKNWTSTMLL